ncbi:MAG: D-hexose-6-phosphate mutarotase [Acidobacteriota bacterium]
MDLNELQRRFARPGVLTFDEEQNLIRLKLRTTHASATVYLQGAHLAAWQPQGFEPVIFLSRKSDLGPGKPIRGGVPIVFPWFAGDSKRDRIDGHPGPSHGFARIQDWTLLAAEPDGDAILLRFELGPTAMSRSMGFDNFRLTQQFRIGHELTMQLTVSNEGKQPLSFEQAFHSYYNVTDVHEVTLNGLEPTAFIDKTDDFKLKPASHEPLRFVTFTDRIYNGTTATCTLHDVAGRRRITVSKSGSNTTVVWTPFKELPDLGPWEWHEMLAVETANVGTNSVTLAAGASSTLGAHVSVAKP